jgi:ribonuclease Z
MNTWAMGRRGPLPEANGRLDPIAIPGPSEGGGPAVVLDEDGLRITAFKVTHDPVKPAYGHRFDYGGDSFQGPVRLEL